MGGALCNVETMECLLQKDLSAFNIQQRAHDISSSLQELPFTNKNLMRYLELPLKSKVNCSKIRFVCISDTHLLHEDVTLPPGDILIHAGDFCEVGNVEEVRAFNLWLGRQPYKHRVVVAGNHEKCLDKRHSGGRVDGHSLLTNCVYLENELAIVDGFRIFGSPATPIFRTTPFSLTPRDSINTWKKIPSMLDILITHSPPLGILDDVRGRRNVHVGCPFLQLEVANRIHPSVHLFGHVHENPGARKLGETIYINAALQDNSKRVSNRQPIVFDLARK